MQAQGYALARPQGSGACGRTRAETDREFGLVIDGDQGKGRFPWNTASRTVPWKVIVCAGSALAPSTTNSLSGRMTSDQCFVD